MHVVATAGHVDHGKSALARALTGMEPDRWEEERRRGLTLDLGFVWTRLPGAGRLALVDVPGHERLVGNMLAGVGPSPAVLFVVAADQGWQAQSQEHLAILDALGVRHGVLAVTRSDLADPEPVRADVLTRIDVTSLRGLESVAVSAVTGRGLDDLRDALTRLVRSLPPPDTEADVRLWVDRVFTVRGRGTVVTGTLRAGTVRVGDRLEPAPGEGLLRVRGLQALKEDQDAVPAVARVAVNVHGAAAEHLRRGDTLLTPGGWTATDRMDVRLHGEAAPDLPRRLVLHVGTAARPVTVRPLGPDTARLTCVHPLPLHVGDTALLRDPGRHAVPAGVTVLDVRPPPLNRRGAARARAATLEGLTGKPDAASELARLGLLRRADLHAMGVPPQSEPVAGAWFADPDHWTHLGERLVATVEEHATAHPADPGLPVEAARRRLDLPDRSLVHALAAPVAALRHRDGRLYGSADRPVLPTAARAAVRTLREDLTARPFHAPEADRLAQLGLSAPLVAAAEAAGDLLRVADGIVLLPGDDKLAAAVLEALPQPFTVSEARRALDSSRRVVVPLLEHLDAAGRTERVDDSGRRRVRPLARAPDDVRGSGGGRESNPPARDPRTPRF
jgi:selenocysteine-specific elongation factor